MNIDLTPRQTAGLARLVAEFNDRVAEEDQLTAEEYALKEFGVLAQTWEQHAPISIPTGEWMQRWTEAEQAAALGLAAQSPDIMSMWVELLKSPTVNLQHPMLVAGVPRLCAALESAGAISSGQAATRAAQIMAY